MTTSDLRRRPADRPGPHGIDPDGRGGTTPAVAGHGSFFLSSGGLSGSVPSAAPAPTAGSPPADLRAWVVRGLVLLGLVLVAVAVVAYPIGPMFASRSQVQLTQDLQLAVDEAYGAANDSLEGAVAPTRAVPIGDPVALLQITRLREQQAVAEGASASVLRGGVGHVPGTAAPGQPGNAVLVGRNAAFGGPFSSLDTLHSGDPIILSTTQGKIVYVVEKVTHDRVTDALYDPTPTDQLTLITSDSVLPWNSVRATIVTAKLRGAAFVPTPQNGFATEQDGRHGESSAWALLVLEVLGLAAGLVGAVLAYRRLSRPMAYLVTTPPLIALVVFAALTATRLFPGWA